MLDGSYRGTKFNIARLFCFLAALVFILTGCSSNNQKGSIVNYEDWNTWASIKYPTDLTKDPVIELNKSIVVEDLVVIDLVQGENRSAEINSILEVNYVGIGGTTKSIFDSSYFRGESAEFPLQAVIKGWQDGLLGMKEGGRRILLIPGALAYGQMPPFGSGILDNESLVFVVDLIKTK